jgi:hypothetical protein
LLVLPIAIVLVMGVASLLGGMGDEMGALVLKRVALGLGIVWALSGICLVVVLGIQSLEREEGGEKRREGIGNREQETGDRGQWKEESEE